MGLPAPFGITASGLPPLGDKASAVLSGQITAIGPTEPFALRGPMNLAIYASINTTFTATKGALAGAVASATGLAVGAAVKSIYAPPGATIGVLSGTTATLALPPVTYFGIINSQTERVTMPPGSNCAALLGATVTVDAGYPAAQAAIPAGTTVQAIITADVAPSVSASGYSSPGTPGVIQLSAIPTATPTNSSPGQPAVPLVFTRTGNAITTAGADAAAIFTGAAIEYSATVQIERSFDGGNTWLVCNIGSAGLLAQFATGTPVSITFGEPERDVFYRLNCIAYSSGTINFRISQTGGSNEAINVGPLSNG